jgi:hypothetical protein
MVSLMFVGLQYPFPLLFGLFRRTSRTLDKSHSDERFNRAPVIKNIFISTQEHNVKIKVVLPMLHLDYKSLQNVITGSAK